MNRTFSRRAALAGLAMICSAGVARADQSYTAVSLEGGKQAEIGEMRFGYHQLLTMVSAQPSQRALLENVATRVNMKGSIHTGSGISKRGDPDFIPALIDFIRNTFRVELRPH